MASIDINCHSSDILSQEVNRVTSLNISLPEPLREWIEAQIKRGRYGNASEYLRDLIRRDQERMVVRRLFPRREAIGSPAVRDRGREH